MGHFENLNRFPDDIDNGKLIRVIATIVVITVIPDPKTAAPFNDYCVDWAHVNTPTTNISGPLSNFQNAVNIPYEEAPHEVGFFFCRCTYIVWILIGIWANTFRVLEGLIKKGTDPNMINKSFFRR